MRLSARNGRHVAVGNALRQAFDDSGFADAGLTDQHRIVLGAAAQDLDDAFNFAFAAHQRIERTFGAACVRSRLNSASSEVSFGRAAVVFSPDVRASSSRKCREPQSALHQNFRAKALFFAQNSQQQMFRADVLDAQALGFLAGHIQGCACTPR